jgi:dTDP-glucose pyrophosphorylase
MKPIKEENNSDSISIQKTASIINALKKMDASHHKLLMVMENKKFFSLISIGDIQRAIIANIPLESNIERILRDHVKIGKVNDTPEYLKAFMLEYRMEFLPIVDESNTILHIYFWEDFFDSALPIVKNTMNVPVVIMAGGEGLRLKPLTNVLPKPLIPFGEKTIIEEIFKRFGDQGCNKFYVSVNYKAEMIEFYLKNQSLPYNIVFIKEEKPLGTAGSLSLLKNKINETFFVSNCDILIEQDYSEILDYHRANKNEITIIAALKHYPVAYGTIETGENGRLLNIVEKPEITFKINSGMYILEPNLLDAIPGNRVFHITSLIEKILERKGEIGVFPVSEKSWKDIGCWEELKQHLK